MRGTTSGIKPENSFSALSPLSPTVARDARHSHPSPPEKKAASRKKSRLRRKKTRLSQTVGHRVYQGMYIPTGWIHATTDPPRLMALGFAISKLRFRLRLRLHGVVHDMPSPMATCSPSHPSHPTFCSLPPHSSHHPNLTKSSSRYQKEP